MGKADVAWEGKVKCTTGATGIQAQASREGFAEITSGRTISQQGLWALSGSWTVPDAEPGTTGPQSRDEPGKQTTADRGVCGSALKPHDGGKASCGQAEVRTGPGKSDRPGS